LAEPADFQPHLGDAEQPVQQVLVQADVLDAREGDVAQAALEHAAAHHHRVALDAVAVGEVLRERIQRQEGDADPARTARSHCPGDARRRVRTAAAPRTAAAASAA
jgi:hypothetical protein